MAPTPLPTPDPTVPLLDTSLSAKTIAASVPKLYLGQNTIVSDSNNGFQTTLPLTTTNLMYGSGYRITSGSTYDYFNSDNFKIDSLGVINSKGTITSTSTGVNSLAGSLNVTSAVSAGSLSTAGALSAGSASVTGALSSGSISSGAITSSSTMTANNLKITSANLVIDSTSATNSITLNGALKVNAAATGASVFKLDSTTGEMQTYGNISTTGTGTIRAGGALSGAALNVGTLFKVDGFGAMTVKDAGATQAIYSFDKNGNFFTSGSLTAPGTATLASGKFIVEGASGNLATQGTISSGNVAVSGTLKTTGVVNIGGTDASPAIQLSNNGTSYFKNSVQIGDASNQKSILNADGSASFSSGNFALDVSGNVIAKGVASFGNNAVALGYAQGAVPANAKVSVDSAGNVAAAGTLAVAGNSTLTGTLAVASNKLTVNASGDLATAGVLSVSGGKLTVNAAGNIVSQGTVSAANGNFTVDASGNVVAKGTITFAGNSSMTGTLDLTGDTKMTGKLEVTSTVRAGSTLSVTGATTLSSTLAVAGDLAVNTDKFKVTAASGHATMAGNLTVAGNANFSGNQIQLSTDGSVFAKNYVKTDYAFSNYVKSTASDDVLTTVVPAVNSTADQALFNSSTNKYLTTQEYVDRAVFKQAARLNLITKDVDANLATFNNFSKVLAAIEGSDAATIMNGLVDSVDDVKVTVSDVMTSGYNSVVISCVPSVWGDAAAPEPIPTPISNLYKEDGWFYSNLASSSKINWYLPAYSGMKMKDITNLFMNNFLLSTVELPKITIYTSPKKNSTDSLSGVYNAKIEYYFSAATPAAVTAQRSCLYVINAPRNVYSDKSTDMKSGYSKTTQGSSSVTTPITTSTLFSNSFDSTKVGSEDTILTFAIETNESSIKDYMFILQNFNISTKTGTTQMLFQNVSVVNDYLFKYFFRQHPDFSDATTTNNAVDKSNYESYVSNILANSIASIPSSSVVSPQTHVTGITTLSIGGKPVTYDNQTLIFDSNTTSVPLICNLENNNSKLTIKLGLNTFANDVVGDHNGTVMLVPGDNNFVITVKDVANDHSTIINFTAHVKNSDARIDKISIDGSPVLVGAVKNILAGTTSVNVVVTPKSSLANVEVTGATGLVTGNNTITIKVTAEDGITTTTSTLTAHVLSSDTSLSTFTMNGNMILDGSLRNLPAGTTSVTVVAVPSAQSSGAVAVISGASGLVEGDNTLQVVVTAENGATRTYIVSLHVQNNTPGIASMTLNGTSVNVASSQFTLTSTTTNVNVVVTPNSSKSSVVVSNTSNLQIGANTMSVQVTTEQGISQTYNYTLYRQSGDAIISSAYINNQLLTFDGSDNASITLSNGTPVSSVVLNANAHDPNATLSYSLNGANNSVLTSNTNKTVTGLVDGDNTLTITDTAEDTSVFKTYVITIHNLANNADLNTLTANYSDYPQVNLISTPAHTIGSGLGASVDIAINAAVAESHASVAIDGVAGSTKTITATAGSTSNVQVVVTAGDGITKRTYNVSFTMPLPLSNNNSLRTFEYATTESNYFVSYQHFSGSDATIVDLDKANHNITINKTIQSTILFTSIPNDATSASVKITVPIEDRTEVLTFAANSLPIDQLSEDYYSFEYLGRYGSSGTIIIEITAENGDKNTYSITVNVATLATVAPYLNETNYVSYVNTNGLGSDNYYVNSAVSFGTNNNLHLVTLVSNNLVPVYYHSENQNDYFNTRYVICMIYDGSNWKHSFYKSNTIKYNPAGLTGSFLKNDPRYNIVQALPIYHDNNGIVFCFSGTYIYPTDTLGSTIFNYDRIFTPFSFYTMVYQQFNDSIFYRFIRAARYDISPQAMINNYRITGLFINTQFKQVQFIYNLIINGRTNPVYYVYEEIDGNKYKTIVVLNYTQNYRSTFILLHAYESDGTTSINIDNLTFTNVANVNNTNTIEFTTSTGDKYVNIDDANPVASIGSYYRIKKVAPALPVL
jgi:hypothetical protein